MALWRVLDIYKRDASRRGQALAKQRTKDPAFYAGDRVWIWRVRDNGTFHGVEVPCFLGQSPRARELKSSFLTLRQHTKNPA